MGRQIDRQSRCSGTPFVSSAWKQPCISHGGLHPLDEVIGILDVQSDGSFTPSTCEDANVTLVVERVAQVIVQVVDKLLAG